MRCSTRSTAVFRLVAARWWELAGWLASPQRAMGEDGRIVMTFCVRARVVELGLELEWFFKCPRRLLLTADLAAFLDVYRKRLLTPFSSTFRSILGCAVHE
ncbi:hypothetical protein K458DRAFT_419373 [Lentithecium fluviatile CBS 122367]|uniref:Secreted protein n=1 Tax=Lentithecium fluviatile CBS 122367 TaxID=1168545 RepID=A0A6G1IZ57_9PLEO|nr:hypothetical protein K458DRAFT_419373 [Lentithecium fluviatile CBS 122367]